MGIFADEAKKMEKELAERERLEAEREAANATLAKRVSDELVADLLAQRNDIHMRVEKNHVFLSSANAEELGISCQRTAVDNAFVVAGDDGVETTIAQGEMARRVLTWVRNIARLKPVDMPDLVGRRRWP